MRKEIFNMIDRLFKHTDDPEKPCNFMKEMLSQMSDDTLGGLRRLYAAQHVAGCPGCSHTLKNLTELRAQLRQLNGSDSEESPSTPRFAPERQAAVEAAWAALDKGANT